MYHIIVNEDNLKKKKNRKKLAATEKVFKEAGLEYTIHRTNRRGMPAEICSEVTSGKGNTIIAMGGDGTLHEILNGFIDFENNSMGLIPLGTGNDFAAAAGIPLKAKKAAEIIAYGRAKPIDFLQLSSGLRSLNAVGTGIDVDVLKIAYSGKNHAKSKYLRALIKALIRFKSYRYKVVYDGKEEEHYGLIGAAGNGRQFGGGIKCFPDAKIDDGYLDLLVVDFISKIKIIGAFLKLMRGKINKIKQVTAVKTKSFKIIPLDDNCTIQADGELYDNVPLEVELVEGKLNFFIPSV
ncbi:MAG: diacylglycerol kinase family lipid kinase [Clostridia bacterium]|nr:diacylglycerol kinase family lipid kinase [Clostridia bacterium]